jgi:hypothetical protein
MESALYTIVTDAETRDEATIEGLLADELSSQASGWW